eukprot:Seg1219.8 transcript_id=Seg1219.8/GoldUCD/mRNA.D3Y31 product="hypothetical protein" protein_id=Seg1219.8/GoldUCD/D3Y31
MKRAHWTPTQASAVCSSHFTADDYKRRFVSLPGLGKPCHPRLKRDEIGIKSFPTIFKPVLEETSDRSHRQLLKDARKEAASVSHKELTCQESLAVAACSSFEDNVPDSDDVIQSKL